MPKDSKVVCIAILHSCKDAEKVESPSLFNFSLSLDWLVVVVNSTNWVSNNVDTKWAHKWLNDLIEMITKGKTPLDLYRTFRPVFSSNIIMTL